MQQFLTFMPWRGQTNNGRMCFETAAAIAYVTNRTLVIPDHYRSRDEPVEHNEGWLPLHPESYLDFDALRSGIKVVNEATIRRRSNLSFASLPHMQTDKHVVGVVDKDDRLDSFANGRSPVFLTDVMKNADVLHLPAQLEHFYAFLYTGEDVSVRRFVKEHVCLKPFLMETGRDIATVLGKYAAIHVRRGDMLTQYPQVNVSAAEILHNTKRYLKKGSRVYVMTDEKDLSFFKDLCDYYEVLFLKDIPHLIPENTPQEDHIMLLEQLICSRASMFFGTKLSSLSGFVVRMRGYLFQFDQETRFTNGMEGSEIDNQSPAYSWANWMNQGQPLWGRQFREGWKV